MARYSRSAALARWTSGLVLATLTAFQALPALGHDWVAHRLRGPVHVVVGQEWIPIQRGSVVASGSIVRTGPGGTVEFRFDGNMVSLAPDTQVKFIDWSDRGQTWVQQWFGEVEVDVEARNIPHFAVQTPMMVAVVKGTRFKVNSTSTDSTVSVIRGVVAVEDIQRNHSVELGSGQSVSGGSSDVMSVSGTGQLPVVVSATGQAVRGNVPSAPPAVGNGGNPVTNLAGSSNAGGGHTSNVGTLPGNSGNTPASGGGAPGNSGSAPPSNGSAPGNSGNTPASGGSAPGNSGNTPSSNGSAPGNSGNTPASGGGAPGNGGNGSSGGLLGGVDEAVNGLLGRD